jgi:hypothetical protein
MPQVSRYSCARMHSRRGRHLPSHFGLAIRFRRQMGRSAIANDEAGFEFSHGETLILICLRQERPFLIRTKRRSLTIQRSDRAISAYVFQDSFPAHEIPLLLFTPVIVRGTGFRFR